MQTSSDICFVQAHHVYLRAECKEFRDPSRGGSARQTSMGLAFLRLSANEPMNSIALPDEGSRNVSPRSNTPGRTLTISTDTAKSQEWIPAFSACEPKLIHTDTSTNAKASKSYPSRGGVAFTSDLLTSRFLPLQSLLFFRYEQRLHHYFKRT